MFKWTRLQLNMLPAIAVEADNAIEKLEQFIQKVRAYANQEDVQTLSNLRQSIISRIEALDIFYQSNYLDGTISIFHMLKLKLKAAIFRTQDTYNHVISMQLSNKFNSKQNFHYQRQSSSRNRFDDLRASNKTGKLQIMQKSKSRSKSKNKKHSTQFKATDSWARQEQTHFMEQFDDHNNDLIEPLFKSNIKNKEQSAMGSKKIQNKSKQKSMSPFNKKPIKTPEIEPKKIKSSSFINSTSSTKVLQQPKTIYSNQPKSKTNIAGRSKVNPKEQQKIPEMQRNQLKEDPGQFRFTIKMTKQEYKSLLQMKQMIKKGKVI